MHTVLIVEIILITPCMFAHGWGFVVVWYRSRIVSGLLSDDLLLFRGLW